ncbi:hypothetical protein JVT61DRAFT_15156 [Boletus reticuloceps]|uniref:Uncharacterized protein n=1 Tax=Boletus reticuloceps TaxID=495285 RepID=A0A8I3ACC5_9AGAM|nr:hypothetical protein JVT61DRAFT_15156 [Boletus reticuloceps]
MKFHHYSSCWLFTVVFLAAVLMVSVCGAPSCTRTFDNPWGLTKHRQFCSSYRKATLLSTQKRLERAKNAEIAQQKRKDLSARGAMRQPDSRPWRLTPVGRSGSDSVGEPQFPHITLSPASPNAEVLPADIITTRLGIGTSNVLLPPNLLSPSNYEDDHMNAMDSSIDTRSTCGK